MPKVSVIIPCHNGEPYLSEAIQSIVAQTRLPDEVVVVDDGSTDRSAEVARSFGPLVRVVSQPCLGAGAARNAGLAASTGEITAFLDADDLWLPDSLQVRLDRLLANPPVDWVFGKVEQFLSPEHAGELAAQFRCEPGQKEARHIGAILVRRSVLERIGGFDPLIKVGDLMDFVARLIDDGAPHASVDTLVMRRRIHGNNMMIQNRNSHADYLRVLRANLSRRALAAATGAR
jgi:glycosyltransferase involved in cell wall biosynthesis